MNVILNENGKVIRVYTGKNQDSTDDRLLIQAELAEKNDTQVIEQRQHAGFSSRPPTGNERLFVTRINNSYLVSLAEEDGILISGQEAGETAVYSSDGGTIQALIKLLKTGIIEINGNSDFAVRYNALQTAFDELKAAHNSHVHTNPEGGNVGAASVQSTADITTAKVDEVKLP